MKKALSLLLWLAILAVLIGVFGWKTRRQALRDAMKPRPPVYDTMNELRERRTRTRRVRERPPPTRFREPTPARRGDAIRGR